MKIYGIGTDLTNVLRIKRSIKKKEFIERIYHNTEIEKCKKQFNKANCFAKRYAAKEACAKALGTGLARGVFWKDIEVKNNKYGKPKIKLHNKALKFLKKINNELNCTIELSLTDEAHYAIANVIIYENKKTK